MAPSAKLLSFLFLMTIISFSMQIHARESQFFSKVTSVSIPAKEKTTVLPTKDETTSSELEDQQDQPRFIPETQGGYGLYGHETTELPPSTTTTLANVNGAPYTTTPTNVPAYKTQFTGNPTNVGPYKNEFEDEESLNKYLNANDNNDNNNNYYSGANPYYNNNNYYNNKINRNEFNQNGLVDTKLTEKQYTTTPTANENNYYSGSYQHRQGMSDTRYLANGKYYYDVNNENLNYNPNQYKNSRAVTRNGYGNMGYYNNGNRENSFENNNFMEGYQNEEEFQEEKDEFVP